VFILGRQAQCLDAGEVAGNDDNGIFGPETVFAEIPLQDLRVIQGVFFLFNGETMGQAPRPMPHLAATTIKALIMKFQNIYRSFWCHGANIPKLEYLQA